MPIKKKYSCPICIRDTRKSKEFTKQGLGTHTWWKHKRLIDHIDMAADDLRINVEAKWGPANAENQIKVVDKLPDPINHPAHYTFSKIEVIDVIMAWFPDDYVMGCVLKYIARADHKGEKLTDLLKAKWYLNYAIDETERKQAQILAELDGEANQ